MYVVIIKSVVT